MLRQRFFQQLLQLMERVEREQSENIVTAGRVIADAMAAGACVHIYDTGHMLNSELINRAGGLTAFRALHINLGVTDNVRSRPEDSEKERRMEGWMRYALKQSRLCAGDVLVIGTVSGKSVDPVDLALAAKDAGAYVIGMTSVAYSSMLKSDHSSGKRLFEVVDLVLDNCAPPLDAMVEVPGRDISICPASGLAAAAIMWAIEAEVVDNLLKLNKTPSILKSINFPGSAEYNETAYQNYAETGC
jgi:uncharacterized phosphosugar-binding protein